MATFSDEVQVMPGVYLSSFRAAANNPTTAPTEQRSKEGAITVMTASGVEVDLDAFDSDNVDILQQEIARLRLSVEKLLESNSLLKEFNMQEPDPEYELAIKENVQVIDKKLRTIKTLMQKLASISVHSSASISGVPAAAVSSSGPCHAELAGIQNEQPPSQQIQQQPESIISTTVATSVESRNIEEVGVYL